MDILCDSFPTLKYVKKYQIAVLDGPEYECVTNKGHCIETVFEGQCEVLSNKTSKEEEKSRIRETPTLSTDGDSRTDTNLKRLRDFKKNSKK